MKIVRLIEELRREVSAARGRERRVALVPTMGYFHEGHVSLMREARQRVDLPDANGNDAAPGLVVVTLFVNPRQFGPAEDLSAYPRDLERDAELAENAGVDVLFCPDAEEVYPEGFGTTVSVGEAGRILCGTDRPEHFDGVATVVLKLFHMASPDMAIFGWKDAQQFLILRRMVRDFNLPIEMVGVETGRASDGLALSSRNIYLTREERAQAPVLRQSLLAAGEALKGGESVAQAAARFRESMAQAPLFQIAYFEVVSMDELRPLERLSAHNTLAAGGGAHWQGPPD
jgi:pantoate--beta-alanine ligase